jgi:anti-repressor protein
MFEYGFEDGKDFVPILEETNIGRPSTDYALTLDTAKEISMIQRSEKGKQARQYFIACEKQLFAPMIRTHLEVVDSESVAILQASGKT